MYFAIVDSRNDKEMVTSKSRELLESVYKSGFDDEPRSPFKIKAVIDKERYTAGNRKK
jgi:hypothetical protein